MLSPSSSCSSDPEESNGWRNSNEDDSRDEQLHFLQSMVSQYASLVEDMHDKLGQAGQDLVSFLVPDENTTINQDQGHKGQNDVAEKYQVQLSLQDAIIQNLLLQQKVLLEATTVSKKLWHTSLKHIEELEDTRHQGQAQGQNQGPSRLLPSADFFARWKTLTAYASSLEGQIQRLLHDLRFTQGKLLEVCQRAKRSERIRDQEEAIRTSEKTKHLQQTVSQLQSEVEQWRRKFNSNLEQSLKIRLEEERKAWEYQKGASLNLVRVQVEEVILDNLTHAQREAQLVIQIQKLEEEIQEWKCKFAWIASISETAQQVHKPLKETKHPPPPPVAQPQFPQARETQSANSFRVKADAGTQTLHPPPPTTFPPSNFSDPNRERPEMFKNQDQTQIPNQNQANFMELQRQNQEMQAEAVEKVKSLRTQIQELEKANLSLTTRCRELEDKLDFSNNERQKLEKVEEESNFKDNKNELQDLEEERRNLNEKRKDMQIQRLSHQIHLLSQKQSQLLQVIQEEMVISEKWKLEYKELAKSILINNKQ